ncbi:MAG TPA: FRG domain-containing protein [Pirellulales bacterium]|nr:FRG domain-containing protein [Pirellulales bacterium]
MPSDFNVEPNSLFAQILAELLALQRYEDELDRQGLDVPPANSDLRKLTHELIYPSGEQPNLNSIQMRDYANIMALAQHFGLPTRLLDWTRSPYVAAYFATEIAEMNMEPGSERNCCSNDELSTIWAFNTKGADRLTMRNAPDLHVLTVRRAINPNLHAQEGVFTLQEGGLNLGIRTPFATWPIEDVILNVNESDCYPKNHNFLIRINFPRVCGPEIRWLLERLGITAARLFPGHRGAAVAVEEKAYSKLPPE